MTPHLQIAVGQCSDKGRKPVNQDFHGVMVPREPQLGAKGVAIALADGISSSDLSQIASESAVKGFLQDYYATPDTWSVKSSAERVLRATNSWLYAQTRNGPYRYVLDRGYVCTFSALVIHSTRVHLFHVGDARICYLAGNRLEQLTEDHRLWVSAEKSYLSRALGMADRLEIDYQSYPLQVADTFVLMTDGVYEHVEEGFVADAIGDHAEDLDRAARLIVERALERSSTDNLTVQILRIDALPAPAVDELNQQVAALPFPPELRPRMDFDGYEIVRALYASSRSHVYLALDKDSGQQVVLKVPALDKRDDTAHLERLLMEEWVARRIDNAHVLKAMDQTRERRFLYTVTEYLEGQTLEQWMHDNPSPELAQVRDIIEQIAAGVQALHRQEMLHQDLRPQNIMIDRQGTVKLIDFGSVHVSGLARGSDGPAGAAAQPHILGTAQYTAPEYFLGEPGTVRSDLFSIGVIAYQMLSGRLPYGTGVAKASTRASQRRLRYRSVLDDERSIPTWIDGAIRKAVHPSPAKRYDAISEFVHDLRHPNPAFVNQDFKPLMERNPVLFWQGLSLVLFCVVVALLIGRAAETQSTDPTQHPTLIQTEPQHEQARND